MFLFGQLKYSLYLCTTLPGEPSSTDEEPIRMGAYLFNRGWKSRLQPDLYFLYKSPRFDYMVEDYYHYVLKFIHYEEISL